MEIRREQSLRLLWASQASTERDHGVSPVFWKGNSLLSTNIIPRMASANPSLPLPHSPTSAPPPSFWSQQSGPLKQGIKTGLAGTITYAIYAGFHLPQGYWAVFAALVVTQANLGASWKAALYRTIGSTCGALAAALLMPMLGDTPAGAGIALFL